MASVRRWRRRTALTSSGNGPRRSDYSKVLGAEVWIVTTEEAAEELRRDGVVLPILLADEAMILGRMFKIDARAFAVLARIQQTMPGARLRSVGNKGHFNA